MTTRDSRPFIASFGTFCAAECGERIQPGEDVRYLADELMHVECARQVEDRPPARVELVPTCPRCGLLHRGEC